MESQHWTQSYKAAEEDGLLNLDFEAGDSRFILASKSGDTSSASTLHTIFKMENSAISEP